MDNCNTAGKVPVNKVIPLSTVDGPGARTAVFLQGCNIQCAYCHNPETQALCCHCGACVPGCPAGALALRDGAVVWDHTKCVDCDKCIATCAHYASPKVRYMDAAAVMAEVRKSMPFVRGITVSGGECMLHPDFLLELFTLAKAEGLGCLIDSNGTVPFAGHEALLQVADGVMLDVKAWDAEVYTALVERPGAHTGQVGAENAGNSAVKDNLRLLAQRDKIEELRVVCLPGYMDPEAVLDGIATVLGAEKTAKVRLKLIRFRPNGVRGALSEQPATGDVEMQRLQNHAEIKGFANIIVV